MGSMKQSAPLIHPGEILREEFLKPLGLSAYRLAKDTQTDPMRISAIVNEKRSLTADTALKLAAFFDGTTPGFWLNLQAQYDTEKQRRSLRKSLAKIKSFKVVHPDLAAAAGVNRRD